MARGGAVARVEARIGQRARQHHDRQRANVEVDRVAHRARRPVARKLEVRHLSQRVDAGIGPPGAAHARLLAGEAADCLDERTLDGASFGLDLPADEGRAVVLEGDA